MKNARIATSDLSYSGVGCTSDPLEKSDNVQLLLLTGRKAMLASQDSQSINFFKQLLAFRPDDLFAHFWLAQLFDHTLAAQPAVREYRWLINFLPDTWYGFYTQAWANQRIKLNQELDLLQSGRASLDKGDVTEAVRLLSHLTNLQPDNTPAHYYLYQAYQSKGDEMMARSLLPEIADFGYGPDERISTFMNELLPEMAVPLIEAGTWNDAQVANIASWLSWSGDQADSKRLIDVAQKYWGNNSLQTDTGKLFLDFVGAFPGMAADREPMIRNYASTQLKIPPTEFGLGLNLVRNGSFERQTQSFPDDWIFARSVVLDPVANKWKTDPRFFPVAGSEAFGLCNGNSSMRMQVVWSQAENELFSAASQQIKLTEPGIYVLGECYLLTQGSLHVAVNQKDGVLSDMALLASSQPNGYNIQVFKVKQADQPIYVVIKFFGVGRAWVDDLSLQRIILK
jgi:hypothetical protein